MDFGWARSLFSLNGMTAERLGIPLYSYQKLESSKTTNPRWKTLVKLLQIFPNLNLNRAA
jgi:hypothetical protein